MIKRIGNTNIFKPSIQTFRYQTGKERETKYSEKDIINSYYHILSLSNKDHLESYPHQPGKGMKAIFLLSGLIVQQHLYNKTAHYCDEVGL